MSSSASRADVCNTYVSISKLTEDNRWYPRLQQLREFYCSQFVSQPNFFVRVPGRVNIIGEHVDYCGYPVLPMGIDQCIMLAVGYTEENTFLQLRNVQSDKFENFKCDLKTLRTQLSQSNGPKWYKYFMCGVKGIFDTLADSVTPIGMTVALWGDIPPASGLSSSSALVSAATLATAHVFQMPLERKYLASISASCERYIGTQGGGMDQAIAYLAREGCAQLIEFHPELLASPIQLPDGACFVVANSLAEKNKAASSDFNERVVECRLACSILAKKMNFTDWRNFLNFWKLQQELGCTLLEFTTLALEYLSMETYTKASICEELGMEAKEFVTEFLTENTRDMVTFKLRQRTQHVLQESMRVSKFRRLCEQESSGDNLKINFDDGQNDSTDRFQSNVLRNNDGQASLTILLSELLQQSHHSLRYSYECSHPNLDCLVEISNDFGVGARLTGAGWGGCIVALCDSIDTSTRYIQLLKEKYYALLNPDLRKQHEQNDFQDVVFATFPRNGAEIFTDPATTLA